MSYGGGGVRSAHWAGINGPHFLTSNLVRAETPESERAVDFAEIQRSHTDAFRAAHPDQEEVRVSQGLVVRSDRAQSAQKAECHADVEAHTRVRLRHEDQPASCSPRTSSDLRAGHRSPPRSLRLPVGGRGGLRLALAQGLGPALRWKPEVPRPAVTDADDNANGKIHILVAPDVRPTGMMGAPPWTSCS